MGPDFKNILQNLFIFLGIFLLFSSPAVFFKKTVAVQKVSLHFPKQTRQLASRPHPQAEVASRQCDIDSRWRYRCDQDQKNCVKDRRETYLNCKKL